MVPANVVDGGEVECSTSWPDNWSGKVSAGNVHRFRCLPEESANKKGGHGENSGPDKGAVAQRAGSTVA